MLLEKNPFKTSNFLRFLIYILLFVIIFLMIKYMTYGLVLAGDEIFQLLSGKSRYGYCFLFKLSYFFSFYLPKKFGIHYNEFIGYHCIIKGFLYFFICLILSKFINLHKQSKNIQIFAFVISLIVISKDIIYHYQYIETMFVIVRYTIPLLMMLTAFYCIINNIISSSERCKKYIIVAVLCFLCLAYNTEIFFVDSLLFILFTAIFLFIHRKKEIKYIIFPLIAVLFDILLYLSSNVNVLEEKSEYTNKAINFFIFWENYKKYCICDIYYILIPLLILFVVYFLYLIKYKNSIDKEKNIKLYIFALIITFANFMSMFSLIKFDTDLYFQDNIKLVYDILFIIPLFMLCNIKFDKKIFSNLQIFSILLITVFILQNIQFEFNNIKNRINIAKRNFYSMGRLHYRMEKIFRLSSLKNVRPRLYIPDNMMFFINDHFKTNENNGFKRCCEGFCRPFIFMAETYENMDFLKNAGYCLVSEKEAEIFNKEIGFTMKNEEIIKNDFQKLKDDNFILNKSML